MRHCLLLLRVSRLRDHQADYIYIYIYIDRYKGKTSTLSSLTSLFRGEFIRNRLVGMKGSLFGFSLITKLYFYD